jgi:hypothetical protein
MRRAYPETQAREMGVDFRGGINQILAAANAPILCSLGLLRRYALAKGEPQRRDRVGGLIRVGLAPGIKCCSLNLGIEAEAQLAYFEVDVPHVLHVASYSDSLHEAAHLMFGVLRKNKGSHVYDIASLHHVSEEQIGEVFANLMSLVFLFRCDRDRFLNYHLCTYSRSIESAGKDESDTLFRFTELLVLLFFAIDAVPDDLKDPINLPERWLHENESVKCALRRFEDMIDKCGRFFTDYERLWFGGHGEVVQQYCRKQFRIMCREAFKFVPHIYQEVLRIYKDYSKEWLSIKTPGGDTVPKYNFREIDEAIKDALKDGRPLISCLFPNPYYDPDLCAADSKEPWGTEKYVALDHLILVCGLLRLYVPELPDMGRLALHLYRRPDTREVAFPPVVPFIKEKEQKWCSFLLDRGAAAMFCPVPSDRQKRLKKQIVVLKNLWDVSSSLRARRFVEIITRTMGDLLAAK